MNNVDNIKDVDSFYKYWGKVQASQGLINRLVEKYAHQSVKETSVEGLRSQYVELFVYAEVENRFYYERIIDACPRLKRLKTIQEKYFSAYKSGAYITNPDEFFALDKWIDQMTTDKGCQTHYGPFASMFLWNKPVRELGLYLLKDQVALSRYLLTFRRPEKKRGPVPTRHKELEFIKPISQIREDSKFTEFLKKIPKEEGFGRTELLHEATRVYLDYPKEIERLEARANQPDLDDDARSAARTFLRQELEIFEPYNKQFKQMLGHEPEPTLESTVAAVKTVRALFHQLLKEEDVTQEMFDGVERAIKDEDPSSDKDPAWSQTKRFWEALRGDIQKLILASNEKSPQT